MRIGTPASARPARARLATAPCAGGYEHGPPGMTLAVRQPLTGHRRAGRAMDAYARGRLGWK
jgi:hypothetical protein